MHRYVARANVDHYLDLLNGDDLAPHNRATITKLLVEEEDRLSHDLEHLEFAETRAANGRQRVNHVRRLRNAFAFDTAERAQADRLLVNCENLQTLLEDFCHHLRARIDSREL
ncbi:MULTISPECIES: hypothetical protein [unclassified Bradyrhizobium]|uniref:hypothetical protein n=1 Tax=unclassified Bradyrhizobium TaxID=2631580 RepID=UPI00230645C9|nr:MULTISPECIES: hypothetical protein [unclassified Bradyrhizobium]MDA9409416.1 hypothetical protein [Bradyrhizobium sp. CCBAU 45384]MDA9443430.1 hypothetical protein [Bradyrhizobium sp. CCBAU 51745]